MGRGEELRTRYARQEQSDHTRTRGRQVVAMYTEEVVSLCGSWGKSLWQRPQHMKLADRDLEDHPSLSLCITMYKELYDQEQEKHSILLLRGQSADCAQWDMFAWQLRRCGYSCWSSRTFLTDCTFHSRGTGSGPRRITLFRLQRAAGARMFPSLQKAHG